VAKSLWLQPGAVFGPEAIGSGVIGLASLSNAGCTAAVLEAVIFAEGGFCAVFEFTVELADTLEVFKVACAWTWLLVLGGIKFAL